MAIIDGLLQELEQEAKTTRRVLERVPDNHLTWRPHPKARTLGDLALHIAIIPGFVGWWRLLTRAGRADPARLQEACLIFEKLLGWRII
jgi:hypothetical protein